MAVSDGVALSSQLPPGVEVSDHGALQAGVVEGGAEGAPGGVLSGLGGGVVGVDRGRVWDCSRSLVQDWSRRREQRCLGGPTPQPTPRPAVYTCREVEDVEEGCPQRQVVGDELLTPLAGHLEEVVL